MLSNGLQEDASLWDFVQHSQHTMFDLNPNAQEQVSAVTGVGPKVPFRDPVCDPSCNTDGRFSSPCGSLR